MVFRQFLVGAFPKKSARLFQWVVFSVHSEWKIFLFLYLFNRFQSLDIAFLKEESLFQQNSYMLHFVKQKMKHVQPLS